LSEYNLFDLKRLLDTLKTNKPLERGNRTLPVFFMNALWVGKI